MCKKVRYFKELRKQKINSIINNIENRIYVDFREPVEKIKERELSELVSFEIQIDKTFFYDVLCEAANTMLDDITDSLRIETTSESLLTDAINYRLRYRILSSDSVRFRVNYLLKKEIRSRQWGYFGWALKLIT